MLYHYSLDLRHRQRHYYLQSLDLTHEWTNYVHHPNLTSERTNP